MKLVSAVIKPFKLDDVREGLSEIGVQGMTVRKYRVLADKRVILSYTEGPSMLLIFYQR